MQWKDQPNIKSNTIFHRPERPSETKWIQAKPVEIIWDYMRPGGTKWDQVRANLFRRSYGRPSETWWIEGRPRKSNWFQVRPSMTEWIEVSPRELIWYLHSVRMPCIGSAAVSVGWSNYTRSFLAGLGFEVHCLLQELPFGIMESFREPSSLTMRNAPFESGFHQGMPT